MLKKLFTVLAIALAALLILSWIYLPSITRYRELKSEEERLSQKIREIDAQIKTLADERKLLQTDVAYLEKEIREELGFVKPGEIVYELVTRENPSNPDSELLENSATPSKTGASGAKALASGKSRVNPMSVVASLANTAPTVSKKKKSTVSR